MKVVVIDYQVGNISSIINMLKKVGTETICSNKPEDICAADKLILPGVGAFDHGMKHLREAGLIPVLNEEVLEKKKPVLGICLGMQLLLNGSEEGKSEGLGWIPGKCSRFNGYVNSKPLRVPHMGWNVINVKRNNPLLDINETEETRFYFVHSYHAVCANNEDIIAEAQYGDNFPAVIGRQNIFGAQFHPEKSHKFGMRFFKNFIEYST